MPAQPLIAQWEDLARDGSPVVTRCGRHDRPIPIHAHDFWELQLAERGTARHETADGVLQLRRGDVVLLRPGAWHRKDLCHGLVSWACCWSPALLQQGLAGMASDPGLVALLRHTGLSWTAHLDESTTRRCLDHLAAITGASQVAQTARLALLLDALAATRVEVAADPAPPGVRRVLDAFDAFPERPWSIAGAAGSAGLSPTHFARCCRALTGCSPLAYLTRRRLERASALLLADDTTIATVAERCGFSDADYFARCFRRHRGCAPRDWCRHLTARG